MLALLYQSWFFWIQGRESRWLLGGGQVWPVGCRPCGGLVPLEEAVLAGEEAVDVAAGAIAAAHGSAPVDAPRGSVSGCLLVRALGPLLCD